MEPAATGLEQEQERALLRAPAMVALVVLAVVATWH